MTWKINIKELLYRVALLLLVSMVCNIYIYIHFFLSQHLLVITGTATFDCNDCSLDFFTVCAPARVYVCVRSLWRDADEGGGEGRLVLSNFINEGGNVFIPGLDTPTTFQTNPSCYVRWCVCAFLNQALAQSDSQQCIFNRAFPPGCQPVPPWRDNSPADAPSALPTKPTPSTRNLLPWSWWKQDGVWLKRERKKTETAKTIRKEKGRKNAAHLGHRLYRQAKLLFTRGPDKQKANRVNSTEPTVQTPDPAWRPASNMHRYIKHGSCLCM